ncbi:MAG: phospho-N-acetylmuramoyl-pentapeptide-transferase [Oscillospiraceae bacterium]|jgi:phospho-N-acetylmuramoyl-pentapeptide-transferase|nr:phospho-N-acetylmuramoyl-pentapeptide-transferase [Oscillospiraceae bacterium]
MKEMLLSAGISLIGAVTAGYLLLPVLRRLKLGQKILEIGPNWHKSKEGTPTMGGFFFMLAITVAVAAVGWREMLNGQFTHLFILLFAWVCGGIGFIDDLAKVRKKENQGLTAPQKLLLQLSAAAAFLALTRYFGYTTSDVAIPFTSIVLSLPWPVYLTLGILFVAGFVNAVNLADGVDGLCTGEGLPVAVFFGMLALSLENPGAAVFAGALAGGLLGFLWFNFNPAKVFMGDTGSLFIGGALCGLAFAMDRPLILIVAGLVYLLVMLSVVLQVTYFKLTKGKRIFKMSPIHHHFELSGWKEKKVFTVFTAFSMIMCAIAWFG